MTVPMVVLGVALAGRRLPARLRRRRAALARRRRSGPASRRACTPISPACCTSSRWSSSRSASAGAYVAFGQRPVPATQPVGVSPVTTAARHNLYADAFNEAVLMRPGQWLTRALVFFDNRGVDGVVNGLGAPASAAARRDCDASQTGFVRSYALSMLGGSDRRRRRPAGGEVPVISTTSRWSILAADPAGRLAGRLRAAEATEAGWPSRSRWASRSSIVVYTIVLGVAFDTGNGADRFQFQRQLDLDQGVRRAPRVRRRRHRAGAGR